MPRANCPGVWLMHAPALDALRARALARAGRPHAASPRRPEEADDWERRLFAPGKPATWMAGDVAVLEVRGAIYPHRSAAIDELYAYVFGGTMLDDLVRELGRLAADPAVAGVLLSVDSPGGMADGVAEAADAVRRLGKAKPIAAHTSGMAASAGYWLPAAASRFTASPGASVGSVGAVLAILDDREMLEQLGVTERVFTSSVSPDKWPDPATAEGAALYQQWVDDAGRSFVQAVAKYRGVSEAKVKSTFGRGWLLSPEAAREAGAIDAVETLDQAIDHLAARAGGGKAPGRRAASNPTGRAIAPSAVIHIGRARPA